MVEAHVQIVIGYLADVADGLVVLVRQRLELTAGIDRSPKFQAKVTHKGNEILELRSVVGDMCFCDAKVGTERFELALKLAYSLTRGVKGKGLAVTRTEGKESNSSSQREEEQGKETEQGAFV